MAGDPLEERILRRIPLEIAGLAALLAVPVALVFDLLSGAFFFGGGGLAALSFLWLKSALGRVLDRALSRGGGQAGRGALRSGIALYALRFALILAVFLLIMLGYPKKIVAFAAGFSTIIPVFFVETVAVLARAKTWKV